MTATLQYTNRLRKRAKIPYTQTLKVWNGRITRDKWLKVAVRPFVLFAYPAVLWSSVVYALSVGWLIVISESVATIFESKSTYNFTPLQTGLIYISPFVGGLLGTAVAGKVSDIVVRYMTKRNGGIYEPEFRLVMALPIGLSTTIGLMAFGWSSEVHDAWIVPTIFFGLISFGCCLGSTTAITFCVDSYRQYAGEALVTLNFSKSEFSPLLAFVIITCADPLVLLRRAPRPGLFSLYCGLVGCGWLAHRVFGHRGAPAVLSAHVDSHVYVWQAGSHVDCPEAVDGAALTRIMSAHRMYIVLERNSGKIESPETLS
jgi:hypothetical protein